MYMKRFNVCVVYEGLKSGLYLYVSRMLFYVYVVSEGLKLGR